MTPALNGILYICRLFFIEFMGDYKGININRENLNKVLSSFCADLTYSIDVTKQFDRYRISVPDTTGTLIDCTLNVYNSGKGLTSFSMQECKNQTKTKEILEYLITNASFEEKLNARINLKLTSAEHKDVITYLDLCEQKGCTTKNLGPGGIQHIYESIYGDKVFLNYYTSTSTFFVQGQAGYFKGQVMDILSAVLPFKEMVDATLDAYDVTTLNLTAVEKMFLNRLPISSATIMNDKVKSVIMPTFVLESLNIETTDYSYMVFPILKGIEAQMKLFFSNNSITIIQPKHGFGEYLEDLLKNDHYTFKPAMAAKVPCPYTRASLEKLYSYYKTHRHAVFHADGTIIGTDTIDHRTTAVDMITDSINVLEKAANCIKNQNITLLT